MSKKLLVLGLLSLGLFSCSKDKDCNFGEIPPHDHVRGEAKRVGDISMSADKLTSTAFTGKSTSTLTGYEIDGYTAVLYETYDGNKVPFDIQTDVNLNEGTNFLDVYYGDGYHIEVIPSVIPSLSSNWTVDGGVLDDFSHTSTSTTITATMGNDYVSTVSVQGGFHSVEFTLYGYDEGNEAVELGADSVVGEGKNDLVFNTKGEFTTETLNGVDVYEYPLNPKYEKVYLEIKISEQEDQREGEKPIYYLGDHDKASGAFDALKSYVLNYSVQFGDRTLKINVQDVILTEEEINLN